MPLPSPENQEEQSEFVSRCVSDTNIQTEWPNDERRLAICYSIYRRSKKISQASKISWEEISNQGYWLF